MIENFEKLIPKSQRKRSGKAFYSGRQAFESRSDLYVIGLNPAGKPQDYPNETVDSHTQWVLNNSPQNWSAYRDEAWRQERATPGTRPLQRRLLYLFEKIGLDAGEVPASNLIFPRSTRKATQEGSFHTLVSECWPFHREIIERLRVRVVVCFGITDTGPEVCKRLGAYDQFDQCTEDNNRHPAPWTSYSCKNSDGLIVVTLSHPSIAAWTNPRTDPTDLVVRALN